MPLAKGLGLDVLISLAIVCKHAPLALHWRGGFPLECADHPWEHASPPLCSIPSPLRRAWTTLLIPSLARANWVGKCKGKELEGEKCIQTFRESMGDKILDVLSS